MNFKYYFSTILLVVSILFTSCEDQLEEEVFSQLDPATLFNSANGIERVLFGAYRDAQITDNFGGNIWFQEEWTCDHFWETGGAVNLQATVTTQSETVILFWKTLINRRLMMQQKRD